MIRAGKERTMTFFTRRKLTQTASLEEQLRIQEALAAQGIASSAGAGSTGRAMERRARLGGAAGRDVFYTLYVHKNDYDRAAHLLDGLRRGR
ncbi:hypothetical protein [uncultured Oscillibacter sp.]|uniref:hypothetical protein n=1 Tax=uncultured Oscillibacter sp. TaxID=876091 RepID=UPI0026090963|nr:hypothetical protein [uncultured Oscillibacter sp.]